MPRLHARRPSCRAERHRELTTTIPPDRCAAVPRGRLLDARGPAGVHPRAARPKLVKAEARRAASKELVPAPRWPHGSGIGGGAPGLNASVEIAGDYTIDVLANLDPPTAERAVRGGACLARPVAAVESACVCGGGATDPGSGAGPEMRGPAGREPHAVAGKGRGGRDDAKRPPARAAGDDQRQGPYRFSRSTPGRR
jgi:hypothetical protein